MKGKQTEMRNSSNEVIQNPQNTIEWNFKNAEIRWTTAFLFAAHNVKQNTNTSIERNEFMC